MFRAEYVYEIHFDFYNKLYVYLSLGGSKMLQYAEIVASVYQHSEDRQDQQQLVRTASKRRHCQHFN